MVEPWQLNLRHLRAVAAISHLGSISAAAAAANLTQPAVTQALAKLEALIGQRLFERRHDGMVATSAAIALTPRIDAAIEHVGSSRVTMVQLHAFVALARGGSYVSASAATGLSQPSLHRAVRDVALALGRTLVERRGRGLMLTPTGRRTARDFRLAAAELRTGLDDLATLDGRPGGHIAIGAMPLARARLLPAAVAAFHRRFPDVTIGIAEGSHAELLEPLRDGDLDLLIGALRDPVPGADLVQTPLFVDRPIVLGRRGHPLATTPSDDWIRAMAAFPWTISAPGTPLRAQWERMFTRAGVVLPAVPIECGSVIAIRGLLLDSDFLTLLSPDQVAVELEAGWLAQIGPAPTDMVRTIGTTVRSGWNPTSAQRAFLELTARIAARDTSVL